jgi:mannose-1-phosphate guanylyltransferase/mannose-6-phosphate isomerase
MFFMSEQFFERPWGGYMILNESSDGGVVKLLKVKPGSRLSLQMHAHRAEKWYSMTEGLLAQVDGETIEMEERVPVNIGVGIIHRLVNPTAEVGYVIEIITGKYDEDDIVRLEDDFGRN